MCEGFFTGLLFTVASFLAFTAVVIVGEVIKGKLVARGHPPSNWLIYLGWGIGSLCWLGGVFAMFQIFRLVASGIGLCDYEDIGFSGP
jgi:hypothetical protein